MKLLRQIGLTVMCLTIAGCAKTVPVSRNMAFQSAAPTSMATYRNYDVSDVRAFVSPDLRVSEANGYYPITDIVWRGDPVGDRRSQIAEMFETAAARGAETIRGEVPVVVDIELVRFHGVTERTRFSIGGVYDIKFTMIVRNATTGAIIEPTRLIKVDLPAPGGEAAMRLDQTGQTEKVRVTDFLTMVLLHELGRPAPPSSDAV